MTSALSRPFFAASFVLSCVLVAAGAHAAPPKREATLGGGKGSGPIMSMAELRACMKRQAALKTQSDQAVRSQDEMKAERTAIDQASEAIKTDMEKLDRTSKEAVEAFVERAKAHDKRIDDYQARVPAFNEQVQALEAERAAYSKACDGRRYLEDDYKDIQAGK
jgi:chromosome segregation ATPase